MISVDRHLLSAKNKTLLTIIIGLLTDVSIREYGTSPLRKRYQSLMSLNVCLLNEEIAVEITNLIERDVSFVVAFRELLTCIKDIWNNDSKQCNRYQGPLKKFTDNVKNSDVFSERDRNYVIRLTDTLNENFYPILASQQYRNYKKDDIALIEGIPFILTYSETLYMVIPYTVGSRTEEFANLAAPTAVNPSHLIYLAYCSSAIELDEIRKTIPHITNYMKRKELRTVVEFIIGCDSSAKFGDLKNIEHDFKTLSNKRVAKVKTVTAATRREFFCA